MLALPLGPNNGHDIGDKVSGGGSDTNPLPVFVGVGWE